ncbi:L-2-amino-thiazoline-4-carboxylic acid hydrolase [Candidatus Bipolaricaulota bacterium]|nr:L-2-amino-thiazoline-4-carboxylic acid hydrolase [Candidatus Bipolaricaulota bacterium]
MLSQSANQRTFTLRLSDHYMEYFRLYAFVYRHLLERLDPVRVETLWKQADETVEDDLFAAVIGHGWRSDEADGNDLSTLRQTLIGRLFVPSIQGISAQWATDFLTSVSPFRQLDVAFPQLNVQREATTYEALHLLVHGLATFAETIIAQCGKAAEFMIYDALKEEIVDRMNPEITAQDWLGAIFNRSQKANTATETGPTAPLVMGSAGHVEQVIRVAQDEVIVHMTQCSWADYYLERHPSVGPLLGCCVDDPTYRRTAIGLRLQRQFTLMEGDSLCDFRLYPADPGIS